MGRAAPTPIGRKLKAAMVSVNPATGAEITSFPAMTKAEVDAAVEAADEAYRTWRRTSFASRNELMVRAAGMLRDRRHEYARLITTEMGKPITEALAEVDKCSLGCEYYAANAEGLLADQSRATNATESFVAFRPLGVILAIMPWNFPFWQVFRFAAPALMAGNAALLKHASNVTGCAVAIERLFQDVGFPTGIFQSLRIPGAEVASVLADERVAAVTLTGSSEVGATVAAMAGSLIKKQVLELGGADAFVVLEDADIDAAASTACRARFQNNGQSCICAKRFIVVDSVADAFVASLTRRVAQLVIGDPEEAVTQVGPLARADLVDTIADQVDRSVAAGAELVAGGVRIDSAGFFYAPTVLDRVTSEMAVFREETFGPVAAITRVQDESEALDAANDCQYGLGGAVWTADVERGKRFASAVESGSVFINGMTASDPRLPFGGVKRSGYGRELAEFGIREFVNIQTVWVGPAVESLTGARS
ncbi:MAG: NAD-dependent succinate-semialdehyde dehydrogenase [Candidatus Dormibacteria bacterium]